MPLSLGRGAFVFSQLLVASALILSVSGVRPPNYSEKSLCDLWAGARCHATACMPDGKQRCSSESSACRGRDESTVSSERAERVAACARALLQSRCGDPAPAECSGVEGP